MKTLLFLLLAALPVFGSPLKPTEVSADAKWLLHIDFDTFRGTRVGKFLTTELIDKQLNELKQQLKFDFSFAFSKLHSITAYGTQFEGGKPQSGVAIVRVDPEATKAAEGFLAAQLLTNTNGPVKKLQSGATPLYSISEEIFLSLPAPNVVVVAKSRPQLDSALQLLKGSGKSLTQSKAFADYPEVGNSFFLLAVAEGFSTGHAIPVQAKILQMADGARLALGERGDNLYLNLLLRGRTPEVNSQIKQVVEGMIALVSLGQSENKPLNDLVKSLKISGTEKIVNIELLYPLSDAMAHVSEKIDREKISDK